MKIAYGLFLNLLFIGHAFGGPIANVQFIHDYIAAKYNNSSYNYLQVSIESGQSSKAANMQYLLKTIDVANEILNGCQVSDYYGNSTYSTLQAVDTNASIKGIDTLIKYYPASLLDLDNDVIPVPPIDGGCDSTDCAAGGPGTFHDADTRTCINDKWVMICKNIGEISFNGDMFVSFPYSTSAAPKPTQMSLDGFNWFDYKTTPMNMAGLGQWAFSNIKGLAPATDTVWIMTIDGVGTDQYQYYRSNAAGNFNQVAILPNNAVTPPITGVGKWSEHIRISDTQLTAFDYNANKVTLFSSTVSGEPDQKLSQISETTLNTHSGGKYFDCDPDGYCVFIALRCCHGTNPSCGPTPPLPVFPTGLAYRFPFANLSTGLNITPLRDLEVISGQTDVDNNPITTGADVTAIFGNQKGRYRFIKFCNGKFLMFSDALGKAALSTDATGKYWQAVNLPADAVILPPTVPNAMGGCTSSASYDGFESTPGCYDNKFFITGRNGKKVYYSADPSVSGWTAMDLPGTISTRQKFYNFGDFLFIARSGNTFAYNPAFPCDPDPGYFRNGILNTCDNKYYDKVYFYENNGSRSLSDNGGDYCAGICWNSAYVAGTSAENFVLTDCTKKACIPACIIAASGGTPL